MKAYHFLCKKWAIEALNNCRLKIARIDDLNDPFELLSCEMSDPHVKTRFSKAMQDINKKYGILCFSKSWDNPLLWSHYADKHKGICLEFDIRNDENEPSVICVEYIDERVPYKKLTYEKQSPKDGLTNLTKFVWATKYRHWEYENEIRQVLKLSESVKETDLFFRKFNNDMALKEVLIGMRCSETIFNIKAIVASKTVIVKKVKPALKEFKIVEDKSIKS